MAVTPPFQNFNLNEGLEDSFLAGATIAAYQRVLFTASGTILPANNTADASIGVAKQPITNGTVGVVRLDVPQQLGLSNTLINVGDTVYQGPNGLVTAVAANNAQLGVAKYGSPVPGSNTGNNMTPVTILGLRKSA